MTADDAEKLLRVRALFRIGAQVGAPQHIAWSEPLEGAIIEISPSREYVYLDGRRGNSGWLLPAMLRLVEELPGSF